MDETLAALDASLNKRAERTALSMGQYTEHAHAERQSLLTERVNLNRLVRAEIFAVYLTFSDQSASAYFSSLRDAVAFTANVDGGKFHYFIKTLSAVKVSEEVLFMIDTQP